MVPGGDFCAIVALVDPLAADPDAAAQVAQIASTSTRLIIRSGPIADPSERSLSWLPNSRQTFASFCDDLEREVAGSTTSLVLWPHSGGAISDAPSLQSFLRARSREAKHWQFLFDPAALLTPDMHAKAPDHLRRLFDALSAHPAAWAIVHDPKWLEVEPHLWRDCPLPVIVRSNEV